jgi:hypothetical protein
MKDFRHLLRSSFSQSDPAKKLPRRSAAVSSQDKHLFLRLENPARLKPCQTPEVAAEPGTEPEEPMMDAKL